MRRVRRLQASSKRMGEIPNVPRRFGSRGSRLVDREPCEDHLMGLYLDEFIELLFEGWQKFIDFTCKKLEPLTAHVFEFVRPVVEDREADNHLFSTHRNSFSCW